MSDKDEVDGDLSESFIRLISYFILIRRASPTIVLVIWIRIAMSDRL